MRNSPNKVFYVDDLVTAMASDMCVASKMFNALPPLKVPSTWNSINAGFFLAYSRSYSISNLYLGGLKCDSDNEAHAIKLIQAPSPICSHPCNPHMAPFLHLQSNVRLLFD
jgi:hypothetical protein